MWSWGGHGVVLGRSWCGLSKIFGMVGGWSCAGVGISWKFLAMNSLIGKARDCLLELAPRAYAIGLGWDPGLEETPRPPHNLPYPRHMGTSCVAPVFE